MQSADSGCKIAHMTIGARVLKNSAEYLFWLDAFRVTNDNVNTKWFCARLYHCNTLWMAVLINKECVGF